MPGISTIFNIAQAFRESFGIHPPVNYQIPPNPEAYGGTGSGKTRPGYSINQAVALPLQTNTGSPLSDIDVWGRQYFLPVKLAGNFLYFPVIGIKQGLRIIETSVTEQRGDVNEIISTGDIKINIKGIIYRPDGTFPENEIALLNNIFTTGKSVAIQNALTDIVLQTDGGQASTNVIMTDFDLLPSGGKSIAYRAYEMSLKSDLIQTLTITTN